MKTTIGFVLGLFLLACKSENQNPDMAITSVIHQDKVLMDTTSAYMQPEIKPDTLNQVGEAKQAENTTPTTKDNKNASRVNKKQGQAILEFDETVFHFDTINEGTVIEHQFTFTNQGVRPLSIKKVEVTCGCTAPSYPFLPIDPSGSGYIGVRYNSTGKDGPQKAFATVFSDAKNQTVELVLEGFVRKK